MNVELHRAEGRHIEKLRCAVITVSDTRTIETDQSGLLMSRLLTRDGHDVVERTVVSDDSEKISLVLGHWLGEAEIDVVLSSGGTGISARDTTVEVVRGFLERELPGFGELFRYLGFREIGPAAMLSCAVGGVARGKAVFTLPGSPRAVELGLEKLILPELRHLAHELRK